MKKKRGRSGKWAHLEEKVHTCDLRPSFFPLTFYSFPRNRKLAPYQHRHSYSISNRSHRHHNMSPKTEKETDTPLPSIQFTDAPVRLFAKIDIRGEATEELSLVGTIKPRFILPEFGNHNRQSDLKCSFIGSINGCEPTDAMRETTTAAYCNAWGDGLEAWMNGEQNGDPKRWAQEAMRSFSGSFSNAKITIEDPTIQEMEGSVDKTYEPGGTDYEVGVRQLQVHLCHSKGYRKRFPKGRQY